MLQLYVVSELIFEVKDAVYKYWIYLDTVHSYFIKLNWGELFEEADHTLEQQEDTSPSTEFWPLLNSS